MISKKYIQELDWEKMGGLIPVVVQDAGTKEVLMLAYADRNALEKTLDTEMAAFYSRSRRGLWVKGETSGNFMEVDSVLYDCDGDSVIYMVVPGGPACHTGERTCFYREMKKLKRGEEYE